MRLMNVFIIIFLGILLVSFVSSRIINLDTEPRGVSVSFVFTNISNFTELIDTPTNYAGSGGDCLLVNAGENAVEFGACAAAGLRNIFDQTLNTTSNVTFNNITINGGVFVFANLTTDWLFGKVNHSDIQNDPFNYNQTIPFNPFDQTLNITSNVTFNNITITGGLYVGANVTADSYFGDGEFLTGIQHGQLTLFLHDEASDAEGSKELATNRNDTGTVTLSKGITIDGQEYQNWTTDMNVPGLPLLSDGVYEFHFHARVTGAGTKDTTIQFKFYVVNATGTNPSLKFTSEKSEILTTTMTEYNIHLFGNDTALDSEDRLLLSVVVGLDGAGGNPTVEMQIEGDTLTRLEVPSPSPTRELFIPYTGARFNLDYNNKNISNVDWFFGKINHSDIQNDPFDYNQTIPFNPFDQVLNTTSNVTFNNITLSEGLFVGTNVSADWCLAKVNHSDIQNDPFDYNQTIGFWNLTGTNLFQKSLAWNIGIGTTTPTHELNVVGDVNITEETFVENITVNDKICLSSDCSAFIEYDGVNIIIQNG